MGKGHLCDAIKATSGRRRTQTPATTAINEISIRKIDERILRLLGLEDVFDIDYDTYLTLLKEAIVTGSKKLPQEELALLANERKRIRGKKGRFSPKKDKITASKVATTKLLKPSKKL